MHHKSGWHHGHRHAHSHGHSHGHCGGFAAWEGRHHEDHQDGDVGGGQGVRRPLRFLVHRLGLEESQIGELAKILDELKTERAQAEVDRRRTIAAFADAITAEQFDLARAREGGDMRVKTEDHLRTAVLKALQQLHALLTPEQRTRLAYLIRTGTLSI